MALFRRQKQSVGGQRWPLLAIYAAVALILATVVVFGARWVYRSATNEESSQEQPKQTAATPQSESSRQAPTQPPALNNSNPATNQNGLPDNGPGDVVALFVSSSLAAAGLHFILSLRRRSSLELK